MVQKSILAISTARYIAFMSFCVQYFN